MKQSIFFILLFGIASFSCNKETDINNEETNSLNEPLARKPFIGPSPILRSDLPCGTSDSFFPLPLSQRQISQQANLASFTQSPINIDIKYHIVRKNDGTGGINLSDLTTITNNINSAFNTVHYGIVLCVQAPDRLEFINSEVNYINNTALYNTEVNTEFATLAAINNDPDKINIYIVKELTNGTNQIGGIAYVGGNALATNRFNNTYLGSSPAHEVGHNLSLRHTHQSSSSLCLNNNHSSTTGDNIYDTPLDLQLSFSMVNTSCQYTGNQSTNCSEFLPASNTSFNLKNIMSYSRHSCRTGFSVVQHFQMNAQALGSGLGTVGSSGGSSTF